MGYQFTSDEPVPAGIRRIVGEEIALASGYLLASRKPDQKDEAIHEIRKAVKRVRALLRLVEPQLGTHYQTETGAWRKFGQMLSSVRDAGVILELFEELRTDCPPPIYAALHRRLAGSKRTHTRDLGQLTSRLKTGFRQAGNRVKSWPLPDEGFQTLAPGWKQTYRKGARALKAACKDPSADHLHGLRKRTKEHYFQLRLLEDVLDGNLRQQKKRAQRLEEMLGTHHNLAVLKQRILERPPQGSEEFLAVLDSKERHLQSKALKLAARLYHQPAPQITKRLGQSWKHWSDL